MGKETIRRPFGIVGAVDEYRIDRMILKKKRKGMVEK